jgi:hypothetical protein
LQCGVDAVGHDEGRGAELQRRSDEKDVLSPEELANIAEHFGPSGLLRQPS